MRKVLNTMVAVALALAATVSLTACGDDDPEPGPGPQPPVPEKTLKEAHVTASLYVSEDFVKAYDIQGKTVNGEAITLSATPIEMEVSGEMLPMYCMTIENTNRAVPVSAVMNIRFTIKDGYQLPAENLFAISAIGTGDVTYTDGTQTVIARKQESSKSKNVRADKFADYTDYLNKRYGCINATLKSDGDDGYEFDLETSLDD